MAVPNLSTEERAKALQKAQEMRSQRMALRKELKAGNVSLEDVLKREDEIVTRMKVKYLLESLPNVGKITAASIMEEIGINESRRVQGLGKRQKAMILEKLA
ncbi:MAG: integration host factor [Firmicutes bacterium]|nr:integration host factor [Bacillota bacterium]MBQ4092237.1 integration host factor [Bacillota bacterium]MBQ6811341.1 integration host factor [Bacillota bacterium]